MRPLLGAGVHSLPGTLFSRSPLLRREVGARLKLGSRLRVRTSTCLSLAAQCPRARRAAEERHKSSRTVEQPTTFTCYRKTVADSRPAAHGHLRTTALPLEPHLRAAAREPAAAAAPRRRRRPPGGAGRPGAAVRDRAAERALRARCNL